MKFIVRDYINNKKMKFDDTDVGPKSLVHNYVIDRVKSIIKKEERAVTKDFIKDYKSKEVYKKSGLLTCSLDYNLKSKLEKLGYKKISNRLYRKKFSYKDTTMNYFISISIRNNTMLFKFCEPEIVDVIVDVNELDAMLEEYEWFSN